MEFLTANVLDTTTMLTLSPNTGTSENLLNRNKYYQFYTDGMNNDATTMSITITFDATTSISRIALMNHNLKGFNLFYNGSTANTFSFSGGATTTSQFVSNSETSQYFRFSTIQCSSITLDMKTTQSANSEKIISYIYVGDLIYAMDIIPNAKDWKNKVVNKQVVHKLADGGTRIHRISNKYNIDFKLDYISETQRDNLQTIWELQTPFWFCPFGTTTSWDVTFFESVWEGDFTFYEYSDNAASSGFSGQVKLRETPY